MPSLIGFNLVQNLVLEIPMAAFRVRPENTPAAIDRAKASAPRHAREYGERPIDPPVTI